MGVSMNHVNCYILGGGLAGLSAGYHAHKNNISATILERNKHIGGTARSIYQDGFTFDFTGHLLHLHNPYTKNMILSLLDGNLDIYERRAAIFSYDTLTPYPYQIHTYGLPKHVIQECIDGFKRVQSEPKDRSTTLDYNTWSLRTFGDGFHKHFMQPYNSKLWNTDLTQMTAEWCGMFVPKPKLSDIIAGSQRYTGNEYGYNTKFYYPRVGGIQVLSEKIGEYCDISLDTTVEVIDFKNKTIQYSSEPQKHYSHLISTIPLHNLLYKIKDLPQEIIDARKKLKWTSILCINIGVEREKISDKSWIYFPEKQFPFYRVGFPMNFSSHSVPKGCSSMYVEVSYKPDQPIDYHDLSFMQSIYKYLQEARILQPTDKIRTINFIPIRYAYVLYTLDFRANLKIIFDFLNQNNIFCIGRYGAWKYSFMEEAILDGKKIIESIF